VSFCHHLAAIVRVLKTFIDIWLDSNCFRVDLS
jgi:hypothetical protein